MVDAGETERETPLPTGAPPHEPLYHCHEPPVPREPPVTVRVVASPVQIIEGEAEAEVGAIDKLFTVTVVVTQIVVLQVPSALA